MEENKEARVNFNNKKIQNMSGLSIFINLETSIILWRYQICYGVLDSDGLINFPKELEMKIDTRISENENVSSIIMMNL